MYGNVSCSIKEFRTTFNAHDESVKNTNGNNLWGDEPDDICKISEFVNSQTDGST